MSKFNSLRSKLGNFNFCGILQLIQLKISYKKLLVVLILALSFKLRNYLFNQIDDNLFYIENDVKVIELLENLFYSFVVFITILKIIQYFNELRTKIEIPANDILSNWNFETLCLKIKNSDENLEILRSKMIKYLLTTNVSFKNVASIWKFSQTNMNEEFLKFMKSILPNLLLKHYPRNFIIKENKSFFKKVIFLESGQIGVFIDNSFDKFKVFNITSEYADFDCINKDLEIKITSREAKLFSISILNFKSAANELSNDQLRIQLKERLLISSKKIQEISVFYKKFYKTTFKKKIGMLKRDDLLDKIDKTYKEDSHNVFHYFRSNIAEFTSNISQIYNISNINVIYRNDIEDLEIEHTELQF